MSHRLRVVLAMLALYVVWGTTYLGIKVGLEAGLPPAVFLGMRLIPAAAILFAIARARGSRIRLTMAEFRVAASVGVLLLVGGQFLTYVAEQTVPSGLSALIVALLPLWIALAESAFPDMQRPGKLGWLGLVVGFSGLAILMIPRFTSGSVSAELPVLGGVALQVIGTWLWTGGSILSKRKPLEIDGIVMTAWEMLVAGVVMVVFATVSGEWSGLSFTGAGIGALAYLTLFGSCLAFTAFGYALSNLPASKVMTYAYVNPVIAVFAGWVAGRIGLVPAEPVTGWVLAGMAIIVAGVALTTSAPTLPPRRMPSTPRQADLAQKPLVTPEPSEV